MTAQPMREDAPWQAEGQMLTKLLELAYLSQHEAAQALDVSDAAVSSWINGTSKPRPANRHRLVALLRDRGVDPPRGALGSLWGSRPKDGGRAQPDATTAAQPAAPPEPTAAPPGPPEPAAAPEPPEPTAAPAASPKEAPKHVPRLVLVAVGAAVAAIVLLAAVILGHGRSHQVTIKSVCAANLVLRDSPNRLVPDGPAHALSELQRGQQFEIDVRKGNFVHGTELGSGRRGWVLTQYGWLC